MQQGRMQGKFSLLSDHSKCNDDNKSNDNRKRSHNRMDSHNGRICIRASSGRRTRGQAKRTCTGRRRGGLVPDRTAGRLGRDLGGGG